MDAKWSKLWVLFFLLSLNEITLQLYKSIIKLLEKNMQGLKVKDGMWFVMSNIDSHTIE